MISVKVEAPNLYPRTDPEDMDRLKALYEYLDERLDGIESVMSEIPCEKIVVTVNAEN